MACCETAKWKREEIPDHKFDYIDIDDFIDDSWVRKLQYSFIFFLTVKSVLVYTADITILVLMIQSNAFSSTFVCTNSTSANTGINSVLCTSSKITEMLAPVKARPWILLASIIMSLLLLLLDWRKGRIVIQSRDIAYGLTNHVAYRYYVLKSYPHYCFFAEILKSRKTVDVAAFYVFFAFKSWKRLFLAELPRVYINTLTMYDILTSSIPADAKNDNAFVEYGRAFQILYQQKSNNEIALATTVLSTFTISMWVFSFGVIVVAFFMYFPLLYIVRGNLKEYVCHKIDKRISEILKKKSRKRTEEARKAELAELERIQLLKARAAKEGTDPSMFEAQEYKPAPPLGLTQRPTLPDIDVDLDADSRSTYKSSFSGGTAGTYVAGASIVNGYQQGALPPPPPHFIANGPQFMNGGVLMPPVPPQGMAIPPPPGMYPPYMSGNSNGFMAGPPGHPNYNSLARSSYSGHSADSDSQSALLQYDSNAQGVVRGDVIPMRKYSGPLPPPPMSSGVTSPGQGSMTGRGPSSLRDAAGVGGGMHIYARPPPQQQQFQRIAGDDSASIVSGGSGRSAGASPVPHQQHQQQQQYYQLPNFDQRR